MISCGATLRKLEFTYFIYWKYFFQNVLQLTWWRAIMLSNVLQQIFLSIHKNQERRLIFYRGHSIECSVLNRMSQLHVGLLHLGKWYSRAVFVLIWWEFYIKTWSSLMSHEGNVLGVSHSLIIYEAPHASHMLHIWKILTNFTVTRK